MADQAVLKISSMIISASAGKKKAHFGELF